MDQFIRVVKSVETIVVEHREVTAQGGISDRIIRVLLIEDNHDDARLVSEALRKLQGAAYDLEWVDGLSGGMERISAGGIDVVLLDLDLGESCGLETLEALSAQALDLPIIVLSGLQDEDLAEEAVRKGAQDYLVKGQVDRNLLGRSIRYSIERHRLLGELRAASLVDELTGLYNRRGFTTLGGQQLKLGARTRARMCLLFADVDGLKAINDTFGHREGDRALVTIARILGEIFRESDIVARLGGDEFAVLAVVGDEAGPEAPLARLRGRLEACSAKSEQSLSLSVSIGIVHYDPERPCSLEELIERADTLMYEQKRRFQ